MSPRNVCKHTKWSLKEKREESEREESDKERKFSTFCVFFTLVLDTELVSSELC